MMESANKVPFCLAGYDAFDISWIVPARAAVSDAVTNAAQGGSELSFLNTEISQGADQLRTLQRRSAPQDKGRATWRLQSYLHGSVGLAQREFPGPPQVRSGTLTVQVLPFAVVQVQ